MKKKTYTFSGAVTAFYSNSEFSYLKKLVDPGSAVLITDEHIFEAHPKKFRGWNTIVLKPGEPFKVQGTADAVIEQLIKFEADRKTTLVGVGGGVVTDLTGYVASVYMRGIRFGFVPTTVLGLVDASIGGKNGIDVSDYKNLVGTIRQPGFILHDLDFLKSLPEAEWINGFAEIIKHACIKDAFMFRQLESSSLQEFRRNKKAMSALIERNAALKIKVVQKDEFEAGDRKLLNFGHTLGHALETQYELMHGQAVSIGMNAAALFSERLCGFRNALRVATLLEQYGLPVYASFNKQKIFKKIQMDKKREREHIHFVLLEKIGKAVLCRIPLLQLEKLIQELP